MPSLRSRLIYQALKLQRPPYDPNKSVQRQRALLENQVKRVPMPPNVDVQPIAIGKLPAEWLRPVGVDVTLEVWDGMWHVWQAYAGYVPEAQQAIERVGAFIGQHLA
jgi:hypothetical protein